jgi:hypothetical protein
MRRIGYVVGIVLLAFSAGLAGAMVIGTEDAALPESAADEYCKTDLTSPAPHYSTTRR